MHWTRRTFIKTISVAGAGALAGGSTLVTSCQNPSGYDILITGGIVIDGTGAVAFSGDIGIIGDQIVEIGNLVANGGKRVIDATGLIVSPGFIDIHSHTDLSLLVDPKANSKIRQGVTTEVAGQDGSSYAPMTDERLFGLQKGYGKRYGVNINWKDFPTYFDAMEQKTIGVNFTSFVGQGTIRSMVLGNRDMRATTRQIDEMKAMVEESVAGGAWGISSGLEYTPGSFATKEEIAELCKVAQSYGGIYATHIRNEDDRLVEAVEEAIWVAREASIPLQIAHFKSIGKRNLDKVARCFEIIENANGEGMDITLDRYPYIAYATTLQNLFPTSFRAGGGEAFVKRLQNSRILGQMKRAAEAKVNMLGDWSHVMISSVSEKNRSYIGKRVTEIVEGTEENSFEFVRNLLIEEKGSVGMIGFGMSEEEIRLVLTHPLVMISSDGGAAATTGPLSELKPHPRWYGTFPRVLGQYCREKQYFQLPEAIHKMTGMPAKRLGLKDRGKIDVGYAADIVLFNPETVIDQADFFNPHQYAAGIDYVLVNGSSAIEKGEHTGALPGKVLRKG
ncbi:MAG: D-aminoacylase [Gemmatimonadota bacterium]|nr:D-aminoacylase [Gemmatimonadota bacterium]